MEDATTTLTDDLETMAANTTLWLSKRKIAAFFSLFIGLILFGLLLWRIFWVTTVENYELGFVFDRVSGEIEIVEKQGWVVRTPIRYSVHTIDLRPYQITISANERVLNAKLCRFNPAGLQTFVEWHGRDAGDYKENLLEILKCYAFDQTDGADCPFLEVIGEISPNQAAGPPLPKKIVGRDE
jgi:hypothetical protein